MLARFSTDFQCQAVSLGVSELAGPAGSGTKMPRLGPPGLERQTLET